MYDISGFKMPFAAHTADANSAVLFDFDNSTGLLLDTLDHLAARTNDFADVFRIDLDHDDLWCVRAEFFTRSTDRCGHSVEDFQTSVFCSGEC